MINLHQMKDGDKVKIDGISIYPFPLQEQYVYGFLLNENDKEILIIHDEMIGWEPPEEVKNVDLAILPVGIMSKNPFTDEPKINLNHPVLEEEATFEETIEITNKLNAQRIILTHIEEPDELMYKDLKKLEIKLKDNGLNIKFAYDTMKVKI